jgi:hypothetical protein
MSMLRMGGGAPIFSVQKDMKYGKLKRPREGINMENSEKIIEKTVAELRERIQRVHTPTNKALPGSKRPKGQGMDPLANQYAQERRKRLIVQGKQTCIDIHQQ